ncbi:hypothetical protein SDC9_85720 [bioreactor metagenome]|uniref:Uncharacterized protein n=1 Tax=bioreactor metagenome TaxID=1076179 RepID=A0A644ZFK4_9ZZZZ
MHQICWYIARGRLEISRSSIQVLRLIQPETCDDQSRSHSNRFNNTMERDTACGNSVRCLCCARGRVLYAVVCQRTVLQYVRLWFAGGSAGRRRSGRSGLPGRTGRSHAKSDSALHSERGYHAGNGTAPNKTRRQGILGHAARPALRCGFGNADLRRHGHYLAKGGGRRAAHSRGGIPHCRASERETGAAV